MVPTAIGAIRDRGEIYVEDPDGHCLKLVECSFGSRFSLDYTMIRAGDINRTVGWYVHKFGYKVVKRHKSGGTQICFVRSPNAPQEGMSLAIIDNGPTEKGDSKDHISLRVTDLVENLWPTLMQRGATDYRDPESCAPFDYEGATSGIRHTSGPYAFTKDCDGRESELLEL